MQLNEQEINQIASQVAEKVKEELQYPTDEEKAMHLAVNELSSPGIVWDPEKAKNTPCQKFTYDGYTYAWSPGIIGLISEKENPEQLEKYCPGDPEIPPALERRWQTFTAAAKEASRRYHELPPGERKLGKFLQYMHEEAKQRGIEV